MDEAIDLAHRKQLVHKQTVFSQLTDVEAEELGGLFSEQRFAAGQTIVREGDPVDSIMLIVSGTADVKHITIQDGKQQATSVAILSIGDAIGLNETGFYSISGRRTATVVALTDMVLLRLSVAAFHGFALSHSHVSEIMHKNAENIWNDKF